MKIGKFYSWEIISENVAIKEGDKTVIEDGETGIPKEIYWFFECANLHKGDVKKIRVVFKGLNYIGVIRRKNDDIGRVNLAWRGELHNTLKLYYRESMELPLLRFYKMDSNTYEMSFVDDTRIEGDDNIPDSSMFLSGKEGGKQMIYTTKYERTPELRKRAILIHGTKCEVCGFDFEKVYGEIGKDFIEVHHIKPLSIAGECEVDPRTDLVCLCSNCHRMIHRDKSHVLSPDELSSIVEAAKN